MQRSIDGCAFLLQRRRIVVTNSPATKDLARVTLEQVDQVVQGGCYPARLRGPCKVMDVPAIFQDLEPRSFGSKMLLVLCVCMLLGGTRDLLV